MGVFVRVVGRPETAIRAFNTILISGPGGAVGMAASDMFGRNAGRKKPGQARRIARTITQRKKDGKSLHDALAVVNARRSRGF